MNFGAVGKIGEFGGYGLPGLTAVSTPARIPPTGFSQARITPTQSQSYVTQTQYQEKVAAVAPSQSMAATGMFYPVAPSLDGSNASASSSGVRQAAPAAGGMSWLPLLLGVVVIGGGVYFLARRKSGGKSYSMKRANFDHPVA